jgi:hypothetical protein
MKDLFRKLFQNYNLTDQEIETVSREFTFVALMSLVGATKNKLSDEEQQDVQSSFKEKNLEKILDIIKSKYDDKEWGVVLQQHIEPLVTDYVKNVFAT